MKLWIIVFAILLFVGQTTDSLGQSPAKISDDSSEQIVAAYRDGIGALGREPAKAAEIIKRAYALNPKDDIIVYLIASAYTQAGDKSSAIEWLKKLAELKSCFSPSPQTFSSLKESEEYKVAEKLIKANAPSAHQSKIAFTVPEPELIPEGMTYDPVDKAFYLSSLYKRKIVRIKPNKRGLSPLIEDFAASEQDGLYSVLGMKVDTKRRVLWVISSAEPLMKGYRTGDQGKSALFKYDLATRKLLKKFSLNPAPNHLLNDLALASNGDIYLTDTASSEIYFLSHDGESLTVFIPAGKFRVPNGIAISNDDQKLFIADIIQGILTVDVKTKQVAPLPYPQGISTAGIDGLYFYKNSLIGVLNIISGGRVARFYLNTALDKITRSEIIECNNPLFQLPTSGTLAGNEFYYIANSQYESYNPDGTLFPLNKLRDVIILKTKLR